MKTMQEQPSDTTLAAASPLSALVIIILFVIIVTLGTLGWINAQQRASAVDFAFRSTLINNVVQLSRSIPIKYARSLTFSRADLDTPAGHRIREHLQSFHQMAPSHGVYVLGVREGNLFFGPQAHGHDGRQITPSGTPYAHPPGGIMEVFATRAPHVSGPFSDERGLFISGYAPVPDPYSGEVLMVIGADMLAEDWASLMEQARKPSLVITGLLIILILGGTLLLAWRNRNATRITSGWRHLEVLLCAVYGLALTAAIALWIHDTEQRERGTIFAGLANMRADAVADQLHSAEQSLDMFAQLYRASRYVDTDEFAIFSRPLLRDRAVSALAWIPYIPEKLKADVLRPRHELPLDHIPIWQWDPESRQRVPSHGHVLFPSLYVEPPVAQEALLGLDHGTDPKLRSAIDRAWSLQQDITSVYMPDYEGGAYFVYTRLETASQADAEPVQEGLLLAIIQLESVMNAALGQMTHEAPYMAATVREVHGGERRSMHTAREPRVATSGFIRFERPILALGRSFLFAARPSEAFTMAYPPRGSRMAGITGLMLTALLVAFIAFLRKAHTNLEAQVAERTSELHERERRLAYRESMQRLIMLMATRFINLHPDELDKATLEGLSEIGKFAEADRAYQFVYDHQTQTMTNTHEWCAPNMATVKKDCQKLPLPLVFTQVAAHQRGECFYIPDTRLLPKEHLLRPILEAQSIQTIITIPMTYRKECYGFIGFDACRAHRTWSRDEIDLLRVMAELLVNARMRADAEEERIALERQVQQSQRLESIGLLAGGVAHDFNNILTTIMGNADLALMDLAADSPIRNQLQTIEIGAQRAADLCQQMLAYAGKGQFIIETFSLNDMIDEVTDLLRSSITKYAELVIRLAPDLPPIQGDAAQLRQILFNLVINASEALEDRDGSISIHTAFVRCDQTCLERVGLEDTLEPGTFIVLEVSDTGHGMSAETMRHIFDPFFSTKFTGRGLGLSAVMGIVRSHKGALKVQSEPSKGSQFKLWLPATTKQIARTPLNSLRDDTGVPLILEGTNTILLADDEPSIRSLGRKMLERMGFDVITAVDGRDAVERYRTHPSQIACVVMDLTMPHLGGEEACYEIQKINPKARIILASGYSKQELSERLGTDGIAAFVQKPFSSETLRCALREALETTK